MKKNLFFLTFFLFSFAFAQNAEADSLQNILKNTKDFSQKTIILNKIASAYKSSDPKLMQKFAKEALEISTNTSNKKEEAKALQNLGTANFLLGNYDEALKNFQNSENLLSNLDKNDKEILEALTKVTANRGIIFAEQNNYAEALKNDFKALNYCEKLGNEIQKSLILNNIGVVYRSIEDDDKALKYFLEAHKIQKKNPQYGFGDICDNIGLIYLNNKNFTQAKLYFDEAEKAFKENENYRGLGELYNSFSQFYLEKNQPEISKNYLLKAEETFKKTDDNFGLSDTYLFLGRIFLNENNLDKALENAQKSLKISNELDLPEAKMNCEKLLSEIYEKKGDKNMALLHLKNYNENSAKLSETENAKERIRTELNFEYEKQNLEKKERENREKLWALLLFLTLASVSGIAFIIYKNKKAKENILLQKQLAEFQYKALHLQMNPHFVFNCLAAISSYVVQNGKEDAIKYISKFSKLMRLTLEFSKESVVSIDKEIEALQNYLELEQLRFPNKFDFKIFKDQKIEDDTAIPSLLLQPYVENAVIHGVVPKDGKGFIKISFQQEENRLICQIEDDGIGINTSLKNKEKLVNIHKSMALEISKKRLETMEKVDKKQVKMNIGEIGNSQGTKVTLELPLEYLK